MAKFKPKNLTSQGDQAWDNFTRAINSGDNVETIRSLCQANPSFAQAGLFYAAFMGSSTASMEVLINQGARIDAQHEGKTPLQTASDAVVLEYLFKKTPKEQQKAFLEEKDGNGKTVLHRLCKGYESDEKIRAIQTFIANGANVNVLSSPGEETPIVIAAAERNPRTVKALLDAGAIDLNKALAKAQDHRDERQMIQDIETALRDPRRGNPPPKQKTAPTAQFPAVAASAVGAFTSSSATPPRSSTQRRPAGPSRNMEATSYPDVVDDALNVFLEALNKTDQRHLQGKSKDEWVAYARARHERFKDANNNSGGYKAYESVCNPAGINMISSKEQAAVNSPFDIMQKIMTSFTGSSGFDPSRLTEQLKHQHSSAYPPLRVPEWRVLQNTFKERYPDPSATVPFGAMPTSPSRSSTMSLSQESNSISQEPRATATVMRGQNSNPSSSPASQADQSRRVPPQANTVPAARGPGSSAQPYPPQPAYHQPYPPAAGGAGYPAHTPPMGSRQPLLLPESMKPLVRARHTDIRSLSRDEAQRLNHAIQQVVESARPDTLLPAQRIVGRDGNIYWQYRLEPDGGTLTLREHEDGKFSVAENRLAPGKSLDISFPRHGVDGQFDMICFESSGITSVISSTGGECSMHHSEVERNPRYFAVSDQQKVLEERAQEMARAEARHLGTAMLNHAAPPHRSAASAQRDIDDSDDERAHKRPRIDSSRNSTELRTRIGQLNPQKGPSRRDSSDLSDSDHERTDIFSKSDSKSYDATSHSSSSDDKRGSSSNRSSSSMDSQSRRRSSRLEAGYDSDVPAEAEQAGYTALSDFDGGKQTRNGSRKKNHKPYADHWGKDFSTHSAYSSDDSDHEVPLERKSKGQRNQNQDNSGKHSHSRTSSIGSMENVSDATIVSPTPTNAISRSGSPRVGGKKDKKDRGESPPPF